ncbi:hypothetical protein QAD02_007446 [Eretmocerus hayati]|uniref:Uncharacterized protein n=1 Tax=Eretmocerus hayati TaxID=131215 RepID=A0ACC2N3L2_9HYME|nr:hypothetical protein QAD02_007446 [Eretmocerus hayati]
MWHCKFCQFTTRTLGAHLSHQIFHRNINRFYHCGFNKCPRFYRTSYLMKQHVRRCHRLSLRLENPQSVQAANAYGKFICTVISCRKECDVLSELIKHLKVHLNNQQEIVCPISGCRKKFVRSNSFSVHLSRYHRSDYRKIEVGAENTSHVGPAIGARNDHQTNQSDSGIDRNDTDLYAYVCDDERMELANDNNNSAESNETFLQKVAEFYLKLESECIVPVKTIQKIIDEMMGLHNVARNLLKVKLSEKLVAENISSERVNRIFNEVFASDPISSSFDKLKSDHFRKKYWREKYDYVPPRFVEIVKERNTFFAYVPILETLRCIYSDKSVQTEFNKPLEEPTPGVLQNFRDGLSFKSNKKIQMLSR